METAQEFIGRYLREKSENHQIARQNSMSLHQNFFSHDYLKHIQDWQVSQGDTPESFETADIVETSAKIITIGVF